MASHHHHHYHHQSPPPATTAACCRSCCYSCSSCCCTPPHHHAQSPPPPPPLDPLLKALVSHLQQPPQPHLYAPHQAHLNKPYNLRNLQPQQFHQQEGEHHQHHSIISSLLGRLDALESSLHHFSSSRYRPCSLRLRDVAARIIQTHFRAFLVRRSRTLRQLKDLALIKSRFNSLKSSLSDKTPFNSKALSHKTMDLLLKLDSVQGGDPIIRDGKRSISRGLVRFLEFIDGVSVKRQELSTTAMKNVKLASHKSRVLGTHSRDLGGDQREIMEKLRGRVVKIHGFSRVSENDEEDVELEGFQHLSEVDEENSRASINGKHGVSRTRNGILVKKHDGVHSREKKGVSFAEDGNVARAVSNIHEPVPCRDGSVSSDDQGELLENLCSEVEKIKDFANGSEDDDEAHLKTQGGVWRLLTNDENGGSPQTSDEERNPKVNLGTEGIYEISGHFLSKNGNLVFSAPLPVKMESKADLMKNRKAVKIVT